jgi:hypothetical protein
VSAKLAGFVNQIAHKRPLEFRSCAVGGVDVVNRWLPPDAAQAAGFQQNSRAKPGAANIENDDAAIVFGRPSFSY